jgi:c(7)-type cytochrome triheme protein
MLEKWSRVVAGAAVLASAAGIAMPVVVRVPIVKPHGAADPADAGLFSHWQHDQYPCFVCHPAIFPRARKGFTHDEMDEGMFCGACHNGQSAPPASGERAACRKSCHAK